MEPNDLQQTVAAADSIYAVLAIAILGLYILLWRFGGEILKTVRRDNVSKAVTELNEALKRHSEDSRITRLEIQKLRVELAQQSTVFASYRNEVDRLLRIFDGRLSALESGESHG